MTAVWDRDKAHDVLLRLLIEAGKPVEYDEQGHDTSSSLADWLDALEACVTPVPAHTIDQAALRDLERATRALALELPASVHEDYSRRLRLVLDSVRPVEGVVLSREEAAVVIDAGRAHLGVQGGRLSDGSFRGRVEAVVKKLEES